MAAGSRFAKVQAGYWTYLNPALQGLNDDVAQLEAGGGGGGGGPAPVAFDTYARKPDGTLQTGFTLDSGHTGTVRASHNDVRFKIVNGSLVHDRGTGSTAAAAYAAATVPGVVGRAWIDFEFTDGNSESAVLIVSGGTQPFTQPISGTNGIVGNGFTSAATHLVIQPGGWNYGILTGDPFTIDTIAENWYSPALAPNVRHTFRVDFDGNKVTITDPFGVQVTRTDARLANPAYHGEHVCVELYSDNGVGSSATKIVGWGATQDAPTSARDFTVAAPPAAQSMLWMPTTDYTFTVPQSSTRISDANFSLPCRVPASAKVKVDVQVYLTQTGTDTTFLMGLNMGSGTGDGIQRVKVGPHTGTIHASWIWEAPPAAIGAVVPLKPEAFIVGTAGVSKIDFSSTMGYYGQISYQPVT